MTGKSLRHDDRQVSESQKAPGCKTDVSDKSVFEQSSADDAEVPGRTMQAIISMRVTLECHPTTDLEADLGC